VDGVRGSSFRVSGLRRGFRAAKKATMTRPIPFILAICVVFSAACDGTLTGIGRTELPPETPLPPAPVESATASHATGESGDSPASKAPEEIVARHLLVMYAGSRSAPPAIKRTKEEARARAEEALARVKAGDDFGDVVAKYTDEPGGAQRKGDLGRFSHDMMVKPFADAAFALSPGQVSTIIETQFGFHVIQRTE
jgi:NIMA-interacting peptidyl-prolyl cis-trans isomerase 1